MLKDFFCHCESNISDRLFNLFILLVFVLFFIFFQDAPAMYMHDTDSALYVRLGQFIFDGKWLGNFDWLTLVKNPFLSIVIYFFKVVGIKYNVGILLIYFCAIFFLLKSLGTTSKIFKIFILFSLVFLPENFSSYRQTVRREDLEISYMLFLCGFYFQFIKSRKIIYLILISLFCGIANITKETNTHFLLFFIVGLSSFIYPFFNSFKKNWKMIFCVLVAAIACYKTPEHLLKFQNYRHYGFYGKNLWHDTNFKKLIEVFYSIKPKNYSQNKVRNPIPSLITDDLSLKLEGDLGKVIKNLDKFYIKDGSNTPGEWGSHFTWALYKSIFNSFSIENPQSFKKIINNLILEFNTFCESQEAYSCQPRGFGFVAHPRYWWPKGQFIYFFKSLIQFSFKFIHFNIGDNSYVNTLSGKNFDDLIQFSQRELILYQFLNYENMEAVKKYRLNSTSLFFLQSFGYLLRYMGLLFLFILLLKNKFKIFYQQFSFLHLGVLTLFGGYFATIFLFYLLLLTRGIKYIVTPSVLLPILTYLLFILLGNKKNQLE